MNVQFYFKKCICSELDIKITSKSCLVHCNSTTGSRKTYFSSKLTTAKETTMFSRFDYQDTRSVNMIWPRHRTRVSPTQQHSAQELGHWFLKNSTKDVRRTFLWEDRKEMGFPNERSQRFMEEKVSSLLSLGGQNSLYLYFVIHASTAEGDTESLSNACSCQGMASLLQAPKHTWFSLYLVTSSYKHFPKSNRFNFALKDLASRICFLAPLVISWHPPVLSSPINYWVCCLEIWYF